MESTVNISAIEAASPATREIISENVHPVGKEKKAKTSMVWREGSFHPERRGAYRDAETFAGFRDETGEASQDWWLVGGLAAIKARASFL